MPFCSGCGNQVTEQDLYCRSCGARQPATEAAPAHGMSPRTASLLCYVPFVGWIAAVVVLASERFRSERTARFHAFQGLYLFVAWLLVRWVLHPIPFLNRAFLHLDNLFQLAIVGVWIFMIVKVSQGHDFSLPILGELAEKSVSES
jgi:uncharacterized membrane protein